MRALAASAFLALLTALAATPTASDFRYQREIQLPAADPAGQSPVACAVLDAAVFAHAAATLDDLRLYSGAGDEMPYAVTLSRTEETGDAARILNLGLKGARHLSFDLQMPSRPYSSLNLMLKAQDFLATARITGLHTLADKSPTYLGTFTLFDLTSQRLGKNAGATFAESTFPYLHVDLQVAPAAGNSPLDVTAAMVASADVPPSRLAQILFTPVAETSMIQQRSRESVANFNIPAHVPVERVSFAIDPGDHTNFSRTVTVSATPTIAPEGEPGTEQLSGEISRVQLTEAGQDIHQESLSIPAILGSNGQAPVAVEVVVQNGDDRPVKLRAVRLEMRERKLCFSLPAAPSAMLMYGDAGLSAPIYDFGRLFNASAKARSAPLGGESLNPHFVVHSPKLSLTERYPQLLWVALFAVVCVLGAVAFRSARIV